MESWAPYKNQMGCLHLLRKREPGLYNCYGYYFPLFRELSHAASGSIGGSSEPMDHIAGNGMWLFQNK